MAVVNRSRKCVALACLALGTAVGCGHEPTAPVQQPVVPTIGPAARVVINPGDTTIDIGADLPLRVFVFDAPGHAITSPAVTAATDKPDVASITAPATVSANFIGKATITVTVAGVSATVHVTVNPHFVTLPFLQGSKSATVAGMNAAGVVVGTMYDDASGSTPRAFRYTASGGVQNLGAEFVYSYGFGVNAGGTTVGWAQASGGVPNIATWSPAGVVQLYGGNYGYGGGAYGLAINNAGQIGAYFNYLIPGYGVINHAGRFDPVTRTMTDVFSANPNGSGAATGISDEGTVIGRGTLPGSQASSFAWSPAGGVHTVPLADGRLVTLAAISPNGTMTGYAGIVGGGVQSVVFSPSGQLTTLPRFGDSLTVVPAGVSDRGDVAGSSSTFLGWPVHVMYWRQDVGLIDVSAPLGPLMYVSGINPSGTTIFGTIDDTPFTSVFRAFNKRPCLWIIRRQ